MTCVRGLSPDGAERMARFFATVVDNPFIPHEPTLKQAHFLKLEDREALFGGAAGGGKSDALLMAALQYVEEPTYSAILFRKTYSDLSLPGALMPRANEWLRGTGARWNEVKKQWRFPSGATLAFGYLEKEADKYRYQSSEFQFIGFDELTQFDETQYTYLMSRLRRLSDSQLPLRMRAATNPGGKGHGWVYRRFVAPGSGRPYVASTLEDNPFLDREEYVRNLEELDAVTQEQLLRGRWVTDPRGKPFKREWWAQGRNRFDATDERLLSRAVFRFWSWDCGIKDGEDNSFTVGIRGDMLPDYRLLIREMYRGRPEFTTLPRVIREHAKRYRGGERLMGIIVEDKANGTPAIQVLREDPDPVIQQHLRAFQPKGSKFERWQAGAVWCERGCVLLPHPSDAAPWLAVFEDEVYEAPESEFDDIPDALSQLIDYTVHMLAAGWRARVNRGLRV